jgi:hypothetical protein
VGTEEEGVGGGEPALVEGRWRRRRRVEPLDPKVRSVEPSEFRGSLREPNRINSWAGLTNLWAEPTHAHILSLKYPQTKVSL